MSERRVPVAALDPPALGAAPVLPFAFGDGGVETPDAALPAGHPAWQRDSLSISSRVRTLLASLKPLAVGVVTFWDHLVRSTRINGRILEIDPSGSYRLR